MGVSLYNQAERKAFARKATDLLAQVNSIYDQTERGLTIEQAKAYIALAQL